MFREQEQERRYISHTYGADEIECDLEITFGGRFHLQNVWTTAYAPTFHRVHPQFRVFGVALYIEEGRLLLWDRNGVIYTEQFKWIAVTRHAFRVLWKAQLPLASRSRL